MGAVVRNFTTARLLERDAQGRWQVGLSEGSATATVTAAVVLNMAGIWIDRVNQSAQPETKRLILGTKGSHIVVKLPAAYRDFGIATVNSIGEGYYCLPSQGGYHHIGPTETVYEGDIDDIRVNRLEIDFLLAETKNILPGLALEPRDVVYCWAGVRPLTFDQAIPKGNRSREIHDLAKQGLPNVLAMTAGPIMSHRSAGREMTVAVRRLISPSGQVHVPDYRPRRLPEDANALPLVDGDDSVRLSHLGFVAESEHARTLGDILFSRTGLGYRHRLKDAEISRAAEAVSAHLDWDDDEIARQIDDVKTRMQTICQPSPSAE